MKSFKEMIEEGWGAAGQKRAHEQHKKEWDELFKKYTKDSKTTAKLKDLRVKNWKASAAKDKLGL